MGLEFVWQDMTTPAIDKAYGDMKGYVRRLSPFTYSWEITRGVAIDFPLVYGLTRTQSSR